ncbi:MAG TPA: M28 family peptidase [Flavobacteriales bacterium]|nr:M28 family peptidase [Flavobacteriales bacterium]HMR26985.1 M28 family peptidase [Flavobacteriales bacterium]
MRHAIVATLLLLTAPALHAQLLSDQEARDQMKYDVQYLASDLLEGREAGTQGERLAGDYIAQKMASIGLMPYGDSATYRQAFTFAAQPVLGDKQVFQLGRERLALNEQYHPLSFSGSGAVLSTVVRCGYGIHAPDLERNDFADLDLTGKCAAIAVGSPDGIHPHSKFLAYHDLELRAAKAVELGASCVLFYNDDKAVEDPPAALRAKARPLPVPVVFLKGDRHAELVRDGNPVSLTVTIERPTSTGHNVVGMLDNGRPTVVVIGAHYDHLGFGDEGSLHRGEPAIHNGADDNASGVAVMLQLARDLAELDEARANDYLFIAFSGEEKGLFGSNFWTKHPTVPLAELNYMINLDMVGRLEADSSIGINGVGTSPAWAELPRVQAGALKVRTTTSGIGPSDHTSFYLQGIPAIHFFTGTHGDYHKPGDDEEKINYDGMLRVARYIESLITTLNDDGRLAFTKTQDADSASTPRFKVTLGVVPDYMYDGKGMRIDGVSEGKPAAAAGLKAGDVVVRMGAVEVADMMGYMKALGQFKKGDTAPVAVLREGQEVVVDVTF